MEDIAEPVLPVDLLHLLCAELAEHLDFSTLYRCAVSSKSFAAAGALSNLYRICQDSPVRGGGNESLSFSDVELATQRWSILWRTVVLSSLGKTLYPYCRYIKVLDLRDLGELLEDDKFRGKIAKNFFAKDLATFNITMAMPNSRQGTRRPARLDSKAIISAIGNVVTAQAPMLEAITEPIIMDVFSNSLLQWAPRLDKLQFLQLGNGKALADEKLQELLCSSCPHLSRIDIFQWTNDDGSDHSLGQFLNRLRPNSLTYFENHSDCGIGPETCKALCNHAKSLTTLYLAVGDNGLHLGHLQPCTAIEALKLTDLRPPHDLKATQNDVFLEIVSWLQECSRLRDIALTDMLSAPAILTPVFEKGALQLEALQINAKENSMYIVKDHQDFHKALSQQKSLKSLLMTADADATFGDDVQILCDCLCALKDLRELKLTRITEYFTDLHVQMIFRHLLNLEDLIVDGYGITDSSLEALSNLGNLKSVNFSGLTSFTANGLLDLVELLGPGNQGLALVVDRAAVESALTEAERDLIRDALASKVQGRFEYQLLKDPDISDFDQSDSD